MADVRSLLEEFSRRFEAGESPDPSEALRRVEGEERQELASLIDQYLMTAPRRSWDPVAYESSGAKAAVDRVYESLEGVSGSWPELLPRLRNSAQVKRSDLVRRLAEALGVGTGEPEVEKVGDYYNRMEHGLLAADGVSRRVTDALAAILGASADAIRSAGTRGIGSEGATGGVAFTRMAAPEARFSAADAGGAFELADAEFDAASPERDEIDRLFEDG